jgi:hypothetical protein
MKWERFSGGPLVPSLVVGAIGLVATGARAFMGSDGLRTALLSYLVAFAYWLGLSLASLLTVMIFRAAKANWSVVARRVFEVMGSTVAIFPLLFLPILLNLKQIYPWAAPNEEMGEEALHLIHHRAVYLNTPFFITRAVIYFFIWILFSQLFLRWSTRQDGENAPQLTQKAWTLGAGGLPVMGLALTFAAIDWLMSLEIFWFSSMWGVYYFAGSFVACMALGILLLQSLSRTPSLDGALKVAHWLSLGKFLLAFTCFWAYVSFSQYMLTWIANLPDAIPFLLKRRAPGWKWAGYALILGHFVIPFLILLSRQTKMKLRRLALVAGWILVIHYVDLYWVVMPQLLTEPSSFDWSNLTAFLGVGGVTLGYGIFVMRGRYALPVGDPFLEASLHYEKML